MIHKIEAKEVKNSEDILFIKKKALSLLKDRWEKEIEANNKASKKLKIDILYIVLLISMLVLIIPRNSKNRIN